MFLSAYMVSLLVWVQIKDTYGYEITALASRLVAEFKGVRIEEMRQEKDIVFTNFCRSMRKEEMFVELSFKTSSYTFNVPLTFSIMISLSLFITRSPRAFAEATLLIVLVHFLCVFSMGMENLTEIFMEKAIERVSSLKLFLYQFLFGFTDNMLIRCEPFLIGFYMYCRFRKQQT